MPAPEEISKLVERYTNNRKQYTSSSYKETEVRREFLDPLFKALGWDVDNTQGHAEQYKEVVHEPSLEVEGGTKSPDYAFRLGEVTKFFVEAKKPSVDICNDKLAAFQLKRYAWSAKLPLSILTNFEDMSVYDCRYEPVKIDDPTKHRILYIPFTELEERWDELTAIFTKKSIKKGSFDKYAQEKKRGTTEVDAKLLKEIEGWREELAKNIARKNELEIEEVNFAVQRLIDRILFLRICEDRKTEPENQLFNIYENRTGIYRHLMDVFQLADAKYNSGLFHFTHDKKRSTKPDRISPRLIIDDKVLASIIYDLYYPNSPYQFDVIPADILGQVYEQFLGKVIKLSASGKTAKVEEKPEVKKAGGVYYTPTYIVEYIVENTVEKLCEKKTPEEMASLKVLDPACGSGSFLIVAYQKMLNKHLEWYEANKPKKHKDQVFQNHKGAWQLTLQEKKRILLNNIHGVDIDSQAVEVTKLNLLLKALEGENKESLDNFGKWFREPALPDLGTNIKCGNSLIDFDITDHLQELDENARNKELARINPFSWEGEFPNIMKAGGFDAVVGNPPYVRMELLKEQRSYFQKNYSVYDGRADLYCYFIEKGLNILKKCGLLSYIVANKWMRANYGQPLRGLLLTKNIIEIVDFGYLPVFKNATTYPCIIKVSNTKPKNSINVTKAESLTFTSLGEYVRDYSHSIEIESLDKENWVLDCERNRNLLKKITSNGILLQKYINGNVYRGIPTGLNEAFIITKTKRDELIAKNPNNAEIIKPFLIGRNIHRYSIENKNNFLIYTYHGVKIERYPEIEEYLEQYKIKLTQRATKQEWYELQQPQFAYRKFMESPKIILPTIIKSAAYAFEPFGFYSNDKTSFISTNDLYLLGILNSLVADFFIHSIASTKQGGYFEYKPMYVSKIPIRTIDFSNPEDKSRHDKMVKLVERMLKLHKDIKEASTPDKQERIRRQIEATDKEIDGLVYELYGLSEEEVRIVERDG